MVLPVFGPVPSRRLGISLGVNNIPPKVCTYACRYCQLGKTLRMSLNPETYFDPDALFKEVEEKIRNHEGAIDYITVVPDGEPTLDLSLGDLAEKLRRFGIPLAIISNGSLVHLDLVRKALHQFNWVSLKVDAVTELVWKRLDRPHPSLNLPDILDGIKLFRRSFAGILNTETMLVKGFNDGIEELKAIAGFLEEVQPDTAWISLPLRPPAESDVLPADNRQLHKALNLFRERVPIVEALNQPEGDAFSASGPDLGEAILEITSVHPIRERALRSLLARKSADWFLIERLLADNLLLEREWQGERFFRRNLERNL